MQHVRHTEELQQLRDYDIYCVTWNKRPWVLLVLQDILEKKEMEKEEKATVTTERFFRQRSPTQQQKRRLYGKSPFSSTLAMVAIRGHWFSPPRRRVRELSFGGFVPFVSIHLPLASFVCLRLGVCKDGFAKEEILWKIVLFFHSCRGRHSRPLVFTTKKKCKRAIFWWLSVFHTIHSRCRMLCLCAPWCV